MGTHQILAILVMTPLVGLAQEERPQFAARDPRYRINAGDVIEVSFRFTPEYNQTLTVNPDGFVSLQAAGDRKIGGKNLVEATQSIRDAYAAFLRDPVVTVVLKEFEKPWFVVGGEVARPGKYDLRGELTLTDAISIAGGFGTGARQGHVLLFRRVSRDTVETKKVDVKALLEKNGLREDLQLQMGDSIYVPRSIPGKIDRFMSVAKLGMYFNPLGVRF